MMIIKLFLKTSVEDHQMTAVDCLSASENGIKNGVVRSPYRQILILPQSTITEFNLAGGALKENVIINEPFDIHSLVSGTVLMLGSVKVRLTFHCEPCRKIKDIVNVKKIGFKRGYLSQILESGTMSIGNDVKILKEKYEPIPYYLVDRIKWYLNKCNTAVPVTKLVSDIGLPKSYCRAIPNIIKNRSDIDQQKILFKNKNSFSNHIF